MTRLKCLLFALLCCLFPRGAYAWDGSASPFDAAHLVLVRPGEWRLGGGPRRQPPLAVKEAAAAQGTAVPVSAPLAAPVEIKSAGRYDLWVRVGRTGATAGALEAELVRGGKVVFAGKLNAGEGAAGSGGPEGYRAYNEKAETNVPGGADANFDLLGGGGAKDNFVQDMAEEAAGGAGQWINSFRVEKLEKGRPFYWWKISGAQLEAGDYELRVRPAGAANANPPLLDTALLTTSTELTYPFVGDIDAPPANYVRFRIDDLGKEKQLFIGLHFSVHRNPFYTTSSADPAGFPKGDKRTPHTKTGYTRWYRLNDIKYVPFGNFTLTINVPGEARGASQFATFPQTDAVDHEFDWHEVDGRYLAIGSPYTGEVFTGRDLSRHHYEYALAATGAHVYPLMRGSQLTLTPAWAQAKGGASEYLAKTMRLLGYNQVDTQNGVADGERYGWLAGGAVGAPGALPYDEDATRQVMDATYRGVFRDPEAWKKAAYVQLADEPVEANTEEYSAPYWRLENGAGEPLDAPAGDGKVRLDEKKVPAGPAGKMAAGGERYRDVTGSSMLNTARVDLQDTVFEGEVSGPWVGFYAALDNAQNPTRGVFWRVGRLSQDSDENVDYGRIGDLRGTSLVRAAAVMSSSKPTPFKIVYEKGKAALYVNGALMQQFEGLSAKGGFGIFGPAKTLYSLRLRAIKADEHIDLDASQFLSDKIDAVDVGGDVVLDARDFDDKPAAADAPPENFRHFVTTQMVQAGGIPAAQAGFRKWCAAQGATPALFGKKSWDEVRMLTIPSLMENAVDRRRYYWSRRYSAWLTPRMYSLAAEALQRHAPNKNTKAFVALSGHALYMHAQQLPMDIMQLAAEGGALVPGVSDWMYVGGWSWDSMQSVAYSVAPMNGGARRYGADWGKEPRSFPMMHQVGPEVFRSYTMLSNQVKHISYWTYGPAYAVTEGAWSDNPGHYSASNFVSNRISQVDDILPAARMRPARVAMLLSRSNEYWDPTSSYADKRAAFLALSHEYYQPEIVTEEQIDEGALQHYDALYVLDTAVKEAAQQKISTWVRGGGLLWACAGAATLNEYGEPLDLLAGLAGLERGFGTAPRKYSPTPQHTKQFGTNGPDDLMTPAAGETSLRAQSAFRRGNLETVRWTGASVRARYADGVLAFGEKTIEKGKVVYLGHRAGTTYSRTALNGRFHTIWAEAPRAMLTLSLHEAKVEREVVLSHSTIMTQPLSTADGTVLIVYSMRPTASTNVQIGLKEPAKPLSVQGFAPHSMQLTDMPFEYRDGRVWITLPTLESHGVGTIIRVRRTPLPPDSRDAELRAKTEQQLKSTDARTHSAGLWFAALNPQWKLVDNAETQLKHDAWEVRFAAAEALWRTERRAAVELVFAAYGAEKDPHVRSEMLFALAHLGHAQAPALALQALDSPRDYVRRQAMRAVLELVQQGTREGAAPTAALKTLAVSAAGLARRHNLPDDRWGRSAGWKQHLMALMDSKAILDEAIAIAQNPAATDPASPWGNDLGPFAAAIAANDALFNEYIARGLPGGAALLLPIAQQRHSPLLVKALEQQLGTLQDPNAEAYLRALETQRDKPLLRLVFARRAELPKPLLAGLAPVLERTFGANLGLDTEEWATWLSENKTD